ncbi:hypothetical protein BDZ89DRAFT_1081036, partial [Hymenopellis radicata]
PAFLTLTHPGNHEAKNYLIAAAFFLAALFIFVLVRFLGQLRLVWSNTRPERDDMGLALRRVGRLFVFIAGHTNAPGAIIDPLSISQGVGSSPIASPPPVHLRFYDVRGGRSADRSIV